MTKAISAALREKAKRVVDCAVHLDETGGNALGLRLLLDECDRQCPGLKDLRSYGTAFMFGTLLQSLLRALHAMLDPPSPDNKSLGRVALMLEDEAVIDFLSQHKVGNLGMPDATRLRVIPERYQHLIDSPAYGIMSQIRYDIIAHRMAPVQQSWNVEYKELITVAKRAEELVAWLQTALGASAVFCTDAARQHMKDTAKLFWFDYTRGTRLKGKPEDQAWLRE